MKYLRTLNIAELLKKKSFFLFGPRSTGKSYLIRQQLGEQAILINLLSPALNLRLTTSPGDFEHPHRAIPLL